MIKIVQHKQNNARNFGDNSGLTQIKNRLKIELRK